MSTEFSWNRSIRWREAEDFRDRNEVFSGLLTYRHIFVSFRDGESAGEQSFAEMVSGDCFDTLGLVAAAGRTFRPDEDQTPGDPRRRGARPRLLAAPVRR